MAIVTMSLALHKPDKYKRTKGKYFKIVVEDEYYGFMHVKVYKDGNIALSANSAMQLSENDLEEILDRVRTAKTLGRTIMWD